MTETTLFELTVLGNPIPKQSVTAGKGKFYTKPAAEEWQELVGLAAFDKWRNSRFFPLDMLEGELCVEVWFYRGNKLGTDNCNMSKPILDAMEGIVYKNDNQFVDEYYHKRHDKENPRVEIRIFRTN